MLTAYTNFFFAVRLVSADCAQVVAEARALREAAWATYDGCTAPHQLLDLPDTDVSGAQALEWMTAMTAAWDDEYPPHACNAGIRGDRRF